MSTVKLKQNYKTYIDDKKLQSLQNFNLPNLQNNSTKSNFNENENLLKNSSSCILKIVNNLPLKIANLPLHKSNQNSVNNSRTTTPGITKRSYFNSIGEIDLQRIKMKDLDKKSININQEAVSQRGSFVNISQFSQIKLERNSSEKSIFSLTKPPFKKNDLEPSINKSQTSNLVNLTNELDSDKFLQFDDISDNTTIKRHDEEVEHKRDINEIKKLQLWDIEHLEPYDLKDTENLLNKIKKVSENKSDAIINKNNQIGSINSVNFIKESIVKLNFKFESRSKNIQEFAKKSEKEQGIILLQNIAHSKRKFNFDVFGFKEKRAIESDLNIDLKEISRSNIDVDTYREIIKEKNKTENRYRKELMNIAKKILEKKILKKKLQSVNSELHADLIKMQKEYDKRKENINKKREQVEKNAGIGFSHGNSGNSFSNSNNQAFNTLTTNKNVLAVLVLGQSAGINPLPSPSSRRASIRKMMQTLDEEEKLKKFNELNRKIDILDREQSDLDEHFKKASSKFEKIIYDNKAQFELTTNEVKYLKRHFQSITKDQRVYYLDILKKGFDVRSEGLVWVVRRLIELDMYLDYSLFPKFVDHEQIDYLIKLANLQLENTQMKILLKVLKNRQQKIREEESNDLLYKASKNQNSGGNLSRTTLFLQNSTNYFGSTDPESILNSKDNKTGLSQRVMNHFEEVFKKYEKIMKTTFEQRIEDVQIQNVVDQLRKKLLHKDHREGEAKKEIEPTNSQTLMKTIYSDNSNIFSEQQAQIQDDKENFVLKYFLENEKQREVFEEILLLRGKIQNNEKEIEKIMSEEVKNFKRRYEAFKNISAHSSLQYDMLYSALFGNSITV
jgi:hypothetical protein